MRKDGTGNGREKDRKEEKDRRPARGKKGQRIWTEMEKEAAGKEEERQKEGEAAGERKKNKGWGQARDCKKSLGWEKPRVGSKVERE